MKWKNLAPNLTRQRVIIEGTSHEIIKPDQIKEYLVALAAELDMEVLRPPYAYDAHELGYGGWIHWRTSGSHFYSYPTNPPLFTVDIYTCKPFDPKKATDFTANYFSSIDIVYKEIEV